MRAELLGSRANLGVGDPFLGLAARFLTRGAVSIGRRVGSAVRRGRGAVAARPTVPMLPTAPPPLRLPAGPSGMLTRVRGVAGLAIPMAARAARTGAALVASGAAIEIGGRLVDRVTGRPIRIRRRMNPTNVRALRRALSRVQGFGKLVRRTDKVLQRCARGVSRRRAPMGRKKCR